MTSDIDWAAHNAAHRQWIADGKHLPFKCPHRQWIADGKHLPFKCPVEGGSIRGWTSI